jgi:hypothetical protein
MKGPSFLMRNLVEITAMILFFMTCEMAPLYSVNKLAVDGR